MKKIVALAALMLIGAVTVAETDQDITFLDIPWETPAYDFYRTMRQKLGSEEVEPGKNDFELAGTVGIQILNPYELTESNVTNGGYIMYDYDVESDIAGYPISFILGGTVFDVEDGKVMQNAETSHLVQMSYQIDISHIHDISAAVSDLTEKLSAKYGQSDKNYTMTLQSSVRKECTLWRGKDSYVLLELRRSKEGTASMLSLEYGISNALGLVDKIIEAQSVKIDPIDSSGL